MTTAVATEIAPIRVLIVEDSPDDAELMELELRRGGLNPVCARVDTKAALEEALRDGRWDLVLSDYSIPGMSMPDALRVVRDASPDVPFVIVSATIGEEAAVEAMRAGAHDYILKHRLARLVPAVKREMRDSAVRRERRQLEDQLRHAQKLESIGMLAGGVAHDFNNLLTGIMGNAAILMEVLPLAEPEQRMLQDVISASERAADLTRQLLAYAGKGAFVLEPVDVSDAVRKLGALLRTIAGAAVDLTLDLADGVPPVEADAGQVQQAFMNLVVNAVEAVGRGPGAVTIRTCVKEIRSGEPLAPCWPAAPAPGTYAAVEVSDTGCGMAAEVMTEMFDPFFTTKFPGRGLGLAAALGIVRSHRGVIHARNTPGIGSTFVVLLPASPHEITEAFPARETVTRGEQSSSAAVLVVDDEEVVRHAARSALEHYGYKVFEATDGRHAVDLFRKLHGQVGAVLLDLTMPVMNGRQAYEQLRRIRPDVRVLVSSGFDESETRRRFGNDRLLNVLEKPYTAAELGARIKALLAA